MSFLRTGATAYTRTLNPGLNPQKVLELELIGGGWVVKCSLWSEVINKSFMTIKLGDSKNEMWPHRYTGFKAWEGTYSGLMRLVYK